RCLAGIFKAYGRNIDVFRGVRRVDRGRGKDGARPCGVKNNIA
ncbi:hypothetical protein LCGC14_3028020, partial [marine sediment metagenome]